MFNRLEVNKMFKGILKELKEALTATPMPQPPEGVIPIQSSITSTHNKKGGSVPALLII